MRKFALPDSPQFIAHLQYRNRRRNENTSPELEAIVDQMAIKPATSARLTLMGKLINAGKRDGWWAKLGGFYMLAAPDAQAAGVNWAKPSGVKLLPTGETTFVADSGYSSDGSTGFLDTQLSMSDFTPFAQDSAHFGGFVKAASATLLNVIGAASGTSNRLSRANSNAIFTNVNSATQTNSVATTYGASKHFMANRNNSANYDQIVNGAVVGNIAVVSIALNTTKMHLLKAGSNFSVATAVLRAVHIGSTLNVTETTSLYNATLSYLNGIGATT